VVFLSLLLLLAELSASDQRFILSYAIECCSSLLLFLCDST
jgi:hypothetical protein